MRYDVGLELLYDVEVELLGPGAAGLRRGRALPQCGRVCVAVVLEENPSELSMFKWIRLCL